MIKHMNSRRIEAFSDGVLAIIITIMVLEFKVPKGGGLVMLKTLLPIFISYVLSFIYIGIYWNQHHHLFQAVDNINGKIMWANLNLLFWLSLIPFTTSWMGQNQFTLWPVILYGIILMMCAISYSLLTKFLLKLHHKESALVKAITKTKKELFTLFIYAAAIPLAFVNPFISLVLYFAVAVYWFKPDGRIEEEMIDPEQPFTEGDEVIPE